jgi:RimJ/RimL family protein N-acetyltransferase
MQRIASAPDVATDRLLLRAHRVDDFGDCAAMWGDARVTRFIGGTPSTAEQSWARLVRNAGHWALLGFGYWLVADRTTGRFIGEVGFADMRRDLDPPLGDAPEAGWVLSPDAHGKGFASEALAAGLAWLEATYAPRETVCIVDPDNAASLHVAAKAGFVERARTRYHDAPTVVLARPGSPRS